MKPSTLKSVPPLKLYYCLQQNWKKAVCWHAPLYTVLLMSNLALATLFSILPHTTSLLCNVFKRSQWQVSCFLSVTLDRPVGQERDKESWGVKTPNNKSENPALITNDIAAGERLRELWWGITILLVLSIHTNKSNESSNENPESLALITNDTTDPQSHYKLPLLAWAWLAVKYTSNYVESREGKLSFGRASFSYPRISRVITAALSVNSFHTHMHMVLMWAAKRVGVAQQGLHYDMFTWVVPKARRTHLPTCV